MGDSCRLTLTVLSDLSPPPRFELILNSLMDRKTKQLEGGSTLALMCGLDIQIFDILTF